MKTLWERNQIWREWILANDKNIQFWRKVNLANLANFSGNSPNSPKFLFAKISSLKVNVWFGSLFIFRCGILLLQSSVPLKHQVSAKCFCFIFNSEIRNLSPMILKMTDTIFISRQDSLFTRANYLWCVFLKVKLYFFKSPLYLFI